MIPSPLPILVGLLLLGNPIASSPGDRCVCETSRGTNGWCRLHGFGYVAGVRITSAWLYEALDAHGHEVNLASFGCPSCQAASASDGFCEKHRIGFVDKKAYFSKLTYYLAKGDVRHLSDIACPVCRRNSETYGWCDRCKVGMVGQVSMVNRASFEQAVNSLHILYAANEAATRCDRCAVAILTDTQCPLCKIRYKDGKAVPRARAQDLAAPGPAPPAPRRPRRRRRPHARCRGDRLPVAEQPSRIPTA